MKKKILLSILLVVFVAAGFSWAAPPIKFGVNEVRSGAFKSNGDRIIWGIKAAVKEINESGGLLGRKIELVIADNQMKSEIAVQNVRKLILEDGCDVIIQGSSSGVGGAIAQAVQRYRKIYLDVAAEAMGITGKNFNPYVFRTCLNAGMHAKALAQYFAKTKLRKVYLLNQDYSWGHDIAKFYEKYIKEAAPDTEIVGKEFHPVFNKDFGPYISKIMASGADYVITGNWGTDLAQLIIQARNLGLNVPIGCTFLDDDGVMNIVREKALGNITANMYMPGLDTPETRAFEKKFYESSGGKWPAFVTYQAYIGVKMFAEAVKRAGTLDTDKVIKAFEGLEFAGPTGVMKMRKEDHQLQTPVIIGKAVKKTKYYDFPYVKPIEVIPAAKVSLSLEDSGWVPYKGR